MLKALHQDWLSNVRNDLLAGMVVALALIPEAIAFSIIAGVDPRVGLYASFCIAVVTSIAGIKQFYEKMAIPADSFARCVVFAMSQPDDVDINEILFRPTAQEL